MRCTTCLPGRGGIKGYKITAEFRSVADGKWMHHHSKTFGASGTLCCFLFNANKKIIRSYPCKVGGIGEKYEGDNTNTPNHVFIPTLEDRRAQATEYDALVAKAIGADGKLKRKNGKK